MTLPIKKQGRIIVVQECPDCSGTGTTTLGENAALRALLRECAGWLERVTDLVPDNPSLTRLLKSISEVGDE